MRAATWPTGYRIAVAGLGVLFYAVPPAQTVTRSLIGLCGAAAIVLGVRWYRPAYGDAWLLLAAGVLCSAVADGLYDSGALAAAEVLYLVTIPFVTVGLLRLARAAMAGGDRASLLDGLTLTCGLGLLSWVFLVDPYVQSPGFTDLEKTVLIAYPLADVLLLATLVQLAVSTRRSPALVLLIAGALGTLAADVLYAKAVLNGDWEPGGLAEAGWLALYALWGAAALHPSMTQVSRPEVRRLGEVGIRRLVVLALSSLVPPAVLLLQAVRGDVRDALVISLVSGLMFLLVLSRLAVAVGTFSRAVGRERGLREAGTSLVSAADSAQVTDAVWQAVVALVPPDRPYRVVFAVNDAGTRPLPIRPGPAWLPAVSAGRGVSMRRVESLDADLAEKLAGFTEALVCPLTLDDRPPGDPRAGVLILAAEQQILLLLRDALQVLASQAALALERIHLTTEIHRRTSLEYFRTLVHHTADVIIVVNDDDEIRYASPSASSIFGAEPEPGTSLLDLVHPKDRAAVQDTLRMVRSPGGHNEWADWSVPHSDGSAVHVEVSCRDLRDDPTVGGLVITLRDVTERRRLETELRHRAFHDSLTGLANRVLFGDQVQQAVTRARRTGAVVGVLFIDLDNFKVVNDTLGHAAGDALLVAVGRRLATVLRSHDTAARLGGDEFAALVEDAVHGADVEHVAERVVAALSEPFRIGKATVNGAGSVGVATTLEAADAQDLLRQADLALYVAKDSGKGRWRRYQPNLHSAIVARLQLRAALDQAVTEGEFTLEYQPIVALDTEEARGYEALVRWHHPTRGLIPPGEFIDLAEETGAIDSIGAWVLDQAIDAAADWHRVVAGDPPYVSINVSARQFRAPDFVNRVRNGLRRRSLPPSALMLEITESLLLRDDERVWVDLTLLRDIGVRVAIDDFGTGFSALSYLRQVPVDVLKIDRSFTDSIASSSQQRAVVDAIVRLAGILGLEVVAEGIETCEDRDLLREMGCPYGQGYLFSRPLRREAALDWHRQRAADRATVSARA